MSRRHYPGLHEEEIPPLPTRDWREQNGWLAVKAEALHCAPPGHGQEPSPRGRKESSDATQGQRDLERRPQERQGNVSADSGVLKATQYSFSTRFENGIGTNPEELIAAAHAGCFSMALSGQLGEAEADANEH